MVRFPAKAREIFKYDLLCYSYHDVRWGLTSAIGPYFALKGFPSYMMTSLKKGSVTGQSLTYIP